MPCLNVINVPSQLDIVTTSLAMLRDMVCVRLCYVLRVWRVSPEVLAAAKKSCLGKVHSPHTKKQV